MTVFIVSFIVFALAIAGLAIGILFGRGGLRPSCGGDSLLRRCGVCRAKEIR